MAFNSEDVIPLSQARARLSELADEVQKGAEKLITKQGESCMALVSAERLDHYHRLEREHIHLLMIEDAKKGLEDLLAGRMMDEDTAMAELKARRQKLKR